MYFVLGAYTTPDCNAASLQLVEVIPVAGCTDEPCYSAGVSDFYYGERCSSTAVSAASAFPASSAAETFSIYNDPLCTDLKVSFAIILNKCVPLDTGSEKLTYSGSNVVLTQYTDLYCSASPTTTAAPANGACSSTGDRYYAATSGNGGSSNGNSGNGNPVATSASSSSNGNPVTTSSGDSNDNPVTASSGNSNDNPVTASSGNSNNNPVTTSSGSSSSSSSSSGSGSSAATASTILGVYSSPDCSADSIQLVEVDPTDGALCTAVPCTASG